MAQPSLNRAERDAAARREVCVGHALEESCADQRALPRFELIEALIEPARAVDCLDRGPGLPAGLDGRIFDAYVSTKSRGSGLGLSLVRDIVRQHGGEVTLENREGGGACARLVLPLDQEDGRQAESR